MGAVRRAACHRGCHFFFSQPDRRKRCRPPASCWPAPAARLPRFCCRLCRGDNVVAIDLITQHIRMKLQQHDLRRIYPNLEVIPSNFQASAARRSAAAACVWWPSLSSH